MAENSIENDLGEFVEEPEKKSLLGKRGGVFKKIFNQKNPSLLLLYPLFCSMNWIQVKLKLNKMLKNRNLLILFFLYSIRPSLCIIQTNY